MPYGIPKDIGGDSPENDSWMERCVSRVERQKGKDGQPYGKDRAIAICKTTLMRTKGNHAKAEFIVNSIIMGKLTIPKEN